eukprot:TRINITY_DN28312_c0_g1_i2.p1 TRINITY_DN28312_c0_g1~~TRINITY_DN28312_c0_g1_i2.p1  ORF type:complete len:121 (+),score=39.42 TRINITY_DN28312_c0_g1_i2:374-736(+)
MLLRVAVDEEDQEACGVVCQLLQCVYLVTAEFEENEEEYGCVGAFLPGFTNSTISGQSVEDPEEMVELPVIPFEGEGEEISLEDLKAHLDEDQLAELMGKLGGLELDEGVSIPLPKPKKK